MIVDADVPDAGIRVGEVIGERAWRVCDDRLWSLTWATIWPTRDPLVASLQYAGRSCRSGYRGGIYAFRRMPAYFFWEPWVLPPDEGIVFGTVRLWGRVVEHEHGFRAEFARPASLLGCYKLRTERATLDRLRTIYDLPLADGSVRAS